MMNITVNGKIQEVNEFKNLEVKSTGIAGGQVLLL